MSQAQSIVSEIEFALSSASGARRVEVLRRVADLFVGEAEQLTAEKTALFDGVMGHLISHIESRAAAELSRRLAPIANAPINTIRFLARHDDIEISGPVLAISERLTDGDLIEIANTKSNDHLCKISDRPHLKESVTDVLVDRGDSDVANRLAKNDGAQFSPIGISKLVMRADGDDGLTESMGRRTDIPASLFRQLMIQATEVARKNLLASAASHLQDTIKQIVAEISAQLTPHTGTLKRKTDAQRVMQKISQDSHLVKAKILEFAVLKRRAEVVAGLAVLVAMPFEQIDRLFYATNGFGLMVLCKTLALDWSDARIIILTSQTMEEQIEELHHQYDALSIGSAQRLFRFWAGRQKVANLSFETATPSTAGNDPAGAPGQIRELASRIPDVALLLRKMLTALQLDAKNADPAIMLDMHRRCIACGDEKRCMLEQNKGTAAKHFREYCPNAAALETLLTLQH